MSKSEINLRLCVAGDKTLIVNFKKCLESYKKQFKIKELLIYTTDNLLQQIKSFAPEAIIIDVDVFYDDYYKKLPKSVKEVLDYSKEHNYCHENPTDKTKKLFYERIRFIMDHYLIAGREQFILSDIDIVILDNIKPIINWIDSDYVLYNADYYNDPRTNNPKMFKKFGGRDFFNKIPQFNTGWLCVPKGFKTNIETICEYMKQEITSYVSEQTAINVYLIKNKFKAKILPRDLMVTDCLDISNKTLIHYGPYELSLKTINKWVVEQ